MVVDFEVKIEVEVEFGDRKDMEERVESDKEIESCDFECEICELGGGNRGAWESYAGNGRKVW